MSADDTEQFLKHMGLQLNIQEKFTLQKVFEKNNPLLRKIIKSHPSNSHGFFLSAELQGYMILDQVVDPYCVVSKTFHVRPILEELFTNPEFLLINVSLYDVKIFRGDSQIVEIIQHFEFDQLPKNFNEVSRIYAPKNIGLISYKTIMILKTIAKKILETTQYQSLPIIVTGIEEMKKIFLHYFEASTTLITQFHDDFYEKSCVEILERSRAYRPVLMDYYSAKLTDQIKRLMKIKRMITDLSEIIKASFDGRVLHLVLPPERKIWGRFNPGSGEFIIHKKIGKTSVDILNELAEEVIRQGGKIQILKPQFFPQNTTVLALVKGNL